MLVDIVFELEKFLKQREENWKNYTGEQKVQYTFHGKFTLPRIDGALLENLEYKGHLRYSQASGAGKIIFSPTKNGNSIREQFIVHLGNLLENTLYPYQIEYDKYEDTCSIRLCANPGIIEKEVKAIEAKLGAPTTGYWGS